MKKAMRAGYGEARFASPKGVELAGYGYFLDRVCTGVMDSLRVRCAIMEGADAKAIILSADLIGLDEETCCLVRSRLEAELGFRQEEILLVCTHTHTGPATNDLVGCGKMDAEYMKTVAQPFIDAARRARRDMRDVTRCEEVCQPIEPIGYNRVWKDGPHDANVRGAMLRRGKAEPIALASYPCHPVTLGRRATCSADYPGALCRLANGQGVRALFLNGCCGDIDPVSNSVRWGSGTRATLREYAGRIWEGFLAGLRATKAPDLACVRFEASIPLRPLERGEIDQLADGFTERRVAAVWRENMLAKLGEPDVETFHVTGLRIGETAFFTVPFEGFTRIGDAAREECPGRNIAVLGCADWTRTYLPEVGPGEELSYAAHAAALLYRHRIIAPGAASSLGRQIGAQARRLFGVDGA